MFWVVSQRDEHDAPTLSLRSGSREKKKSTLLIYKPSGALGEFERSFGGTEKTTQTPLFAKLISIVARLNDAPLDATPPCCSKELEEQYSALMKERKAGRDARSGRGATAKAARTALGFYQAANPNLSEAEAKAAYGDLPRDKKGAYTALATKDTYRRVLESLEFAEFAGLGLVVDDDDDGTS
jgi:hypothetical protein